MNRVLLYIGKGNERYCYAVINSKQYPRGGAGERERGRERNNDRCFEADPSVYRRIAKATRSRLDLTGRELRSIRTGGRGKWNVLRVLFLE